MMRFEKINRSTEENIIITILDDYQIGAFTAMDLKKIAGGQIDNIQIVLEQLAKRKPSFIYRLEKGKYVSRNFRNEYVIGNYLVKDGVIAYWTALNLHGLTEQFANTIFVQTTKQKRKTRIFEVDYKFVKVKPEKLTGIELHGHGNNQFKITDKEKTIIDCFDLPQYSGGYEELIRAFVETKLDGKKLIQYCEAVNNIAVTKRLGYLADLFKKNKLGEFRKYAFGKVNKKYSLFDPLGVNEGEYIAKWKLRLNMKKDDILSVPNNLY